MRRVADTRQRRHATQVVPPVRRPAHRHCRRNRTDRHDGVPVLRRRRQPRHHKTGVRMLCQPRRGVQSHFADRLVVLYEREGIVEMVQQVLPLLVPARLTKAFGVVFEFFPLDQQEIDIRSLEAA